jgi:hypothetical protein
MPEINARTQAVREAGAELGVLIAEFWRHKHPELTTVELAHILAGELESVLKQAVRGEQGKGQRR